MKTLAWQPGDTQGFRHWLRKHVICVLSLAAFLILIRLPGPPSHEQRLLADRFASSGSTARGEVVESFQPLPPESDLVYLSTRKPRPVAPHGWRKTDRGWEDVSTWRPIPRPLGEIVMEQERREAGWTSSALAVVRCVPPLAFATLQIAAISAILSLSRSDRR